MTDRLLTLLMVADLMSCHKQTAKRVLDEHGIKPINIAKRGRACNRYLESVITALMHRMNAEAQAQNRSKLDECPLTSLTADDVYRLTQAGALQ